FDFSAWLERKDPGHRWQIEPVEGGLVNVVVRATHTSQGSSSGAKSAFAPRETLILKYAPPFVAALGPAVPFSEFRQALGTELGTFFAHLHTTAELADDPRSFESPDSQKMISSQIVESIQEHLSQWGVEDAIELAAVIREAYVSLSVPQDRLVFQVGDLWPGSVMVSNDGKRSAVIDWEFAGPGRPLGGMAQL
ncbi:hypothetical protein PUNSTDRAFT_19469, partial [Punctularia strigosozonata HHB-11173 SS5]|uniref:uncharacterized protein n=1 Tax=Punctularia strigosozonata (strain HHB-11173) TaxID=741275 RepID=UPI00044169ED